MHIRALSVERKLPELMFNDSSVRRGGVKCN
jgi:hypothetical protein